jgi:predicted ribosomally synthesized peptide with SipW-like signal peptide
MQKKMMNKKAVIAAGVAGLVLIVGSSLAYFTDYATTQATGTAGTVAIALDSDINLLDANGMDILNPGDKRDGSFEVTNMGNKSIDVRTTLALTALDHEGNAINFTGDAATQSEYDLYLASDVEEVPGEGFKPMTGAAPLEVKSINGNVIKYVLPEYSLNGNSDEHAEVESIDGVNAFAHDYDFVLVFKGETGNEWQDSTIQLDVIVEAKQHENTGAGWDIVAQESLTQGSLTQDVVKGEVVITDAAGAAVNP